MPTGHRLRLLFVGTRSDGQNDAHCHSRTAQLLGRAISQDGRGTVSGHSQRLSFCNSLLPAAKAKRFT